MENHACLGPVCVLKVNDLQCCKACPEKLKKKLMQIQGVISVHIDKEKGLVTVSGVADASILIKAIGKAGNRKAELLMYEKEPKHQHDPNLKETHPIKAKHKNRKHIHHDHHRSNSDESQNDHQQEARKNMKHPHFPPHQFKNDHEAVGPNGAVPGYHDPPPMGMHGYGGSFPGSAPPYPWARRPYGYEGIGPHPMVFERPRRLPPPPPPPVYGYYQPRPLPPRLPAYHGEVKYSDGPFGSSVVHTFSDLNTDGCPIL